MCGQCNRKSCACPKGWGCDGAGTNLEQCLQGRRKEERQQYARRHKAVQAEASALYDRARAAAAPRLPSIPAAKYSDRRLSLC